MPIHNIFYRIVYVVVLLVLSVFRLLFSCVCLSQVERTKLTEGMSELMREFLTIPPLYKADNIERENRLSSQHDLFFKMSKSVTI